MKAIVLHLKNIDINKFQSIDTVFDKKFSEQEEQGETYDKIPDYITELKNWPKKTNVWCINHGTSFNTTPVPIPYMVQQCNKKSQIYTKGVVACSFPCAYNYIITNILDQNDKRMIVDNLKLVHKWMTGKTINKFTLPSLPKEKLVMYGGYMEVDEYVARIIADCKIYSF